MMEHPKPSIEQVERLLAEAHSRRHVIVVGEEWAQGVMRVIRQEATASSRLAWMVPLVWRAAAGAALVAMVFAGSVAAFTSRPPGLVTAGWLEEFDAGPPLIEE